MKTIHSMEEEASLILEREGIVDLDLSAKKGGAKPPKKDKPSGRKQKKSSVSFSQVQQETGSANQQTDAVQANSSPLADTSSFEPEPTDSADSPSVKQPDDEPIAAAMLTNEEVTSQENAKPICESSEVDALPIQQVFDFQTVVISEETHPSQDATDEQPTNNSVGQATSTVEVIEPLQHQYTEQTTIKSVESATELDNAEKETQVIEAPLAVMEPLESIVPEMEFDPEFDSSNTILVRDFESAEEEAANDGRTRFTDLDLPEEICRALKASGYEHPTAIQEAMIPAVLAGRDVLGQAQTGTGKTAAFALPLLSRIDVDNPDTQVLVLAPTRELAIQVAESFEKYGQHLRGLRVAPIYGGSSYATQIHALRRGAHVVVGTPGRVMDHMRESRLRIDNLKCMVLDEADEMLRMGFVDDVQWILEQSPSNRQIALFSATMPRAIREIADRHLKNPHVISIDSNQKTAATIAQRYVLVEPKAKQDALLRILEAEETDGVIIFVKTKMATVELADCLCAMGHSAVALNGDIAQSQRERTIEQLKQGVFNILVATDVAARGLDVQRITHVINYDLPFDSEAYVHRIGRTGRAGRAGHAILFIAPRQRGFLREIDRAAGQQLEPMAVPSGKEINEIRVERFKDRIVAACKANEAGNPQFNLFEKLIAQCAEEHGFSMEKIAAALATIISGDKPFLVAETEKKSPRREVRGLLDEQFADRGGRGRRSEGDYSGRSAGDSVNSGRGREGSDPRGQRREFSGERPARGERRDRRDGDQDMEKFRVEVGRNHGVKPGNLVGAIANEIGLDSNHIGQIQIFDEFSTVDLPSGMPREVFKVLGRAWVVGRQLRISKWTDHPSVRQARPRKPKPTGRR